MGHSDPKCKKGTKNHQVFSVNLRGHTHWPSGLATSKKVFVTTEKFGWQHHATSTSHEFSQSLPLQQRAELADGVAKLSFKKNPDVWFLFMSANAKSSWILPRPNFSHPIWPQGSPTELSVTSIEVPSFEASQFGFGDPSFCRLKFPILGEILQLLDELMVKKIKRTSHQRSIPIFASSIFIGSG